MGDLNRQMERHDLSKVDFAKVYKDKTSNFLSMYDVKQNIIKGKYDRGWTVFKLISENYL